MRTSERADGRTAVYFEAFGRFIPIRSLITWRRAVRTKLNQGETVRNCPNILFDVNDATDPQVRLPARPPARRRARYRIAGFSQSPGHKLQDQLGTCPAFLKIHKARARSYEEAPGIAARVITTNEN